MTIENNAALTSISALSNVESMDDVSIATNPKLTEFTGGSRLASLKSLRISTNAALQTVSLPAVSTAGDVFSIRENAVLTSFSANAVPALRTLEFTDNGAAGITLDVSMAALGSLDYLSLNAHYNTMRFAAATLGTVSSDVTLEFIRMEKLTLPRLQTIGRDLYIEQVSGIDTLELDSLKSVTGTFKINVMALKRLVLPALETVQSLRISSLYSLEELRMDALVRTTGDSTLGGFKILGNKLNGTTGEFSFAALTRVESFELANDDGLKKLTFPKLSRVETYFEIRDNSSLPTCSALALLNQVKNSGGIGTASGVTRNLQDSCSPP